MFVAGAAALVLLFVGIHNAWDAVMYHIFSGRRGQNEGWYCPLQGHLLGTCHHIV
ncbi:MAG TPA: hypothetical protein VFZ27_05385 [Terriglobia bacterium]|nr:hypothetical protein [Terriglobia bacterium]